MNGLMRMMVAASLGAVFAFGGCVKPVSPYDDEMKWMSMVRYPLYMRYHPARWTLAGTRPDGPGRNKYHVAPQDIFLSDISGVYKREPWFREKTQYGPFTVLRDCPLGSAAMLLDEHGKPLWAGAQIIPMHMKGKLESLVLVEEIPRPWDFHVDICPSMERQGAPFYRFVALHMEVITGKQMHRCPLESFGIGFLVDLVRAGQETIHESHVMDVSGKGDDLLGIIRLGGVGRWDGVISGDHEAAPSFVARGGPYWYLVAINAWGRGAMGTELPKGTKPLKVSIIVRTSPKITLSASKKGIDGPVWKTVTYDPDNVTVESVVD
ncbi:MAG: hypothetical protein ISS69_12410 [Phycisphaerae bacterium]|nr:hypothetical protein [Phycisphaerae bacterium]